MMRHKYSNLWLLYASKALQLLFPTLTILVVIRRFTKEEFGYIAISQSVALFASSFIEYGFGYSGARSVSLVRKDERATAKVFYEINGAKMILSIIALPIGLYALIITGVPVKFWLGCLLIAISQGLNLLWFYQGLDRISMPVICDIMSKLVILLIAWLFLPTPEMFVLITGCSQALSLFLLLFDVRRRYDYTKFNFNASMLEIKTGIRLFGFRFGSLLYGGATNMLLAGVVPAGNVAVYAGADRLFRSAAALTAPVGDAFFANISHQLTKDPKIANTTAKLASKIITAVSVTLFLVGEIFAERIIHLLLGENYISSTVTLRILLLTIPLIGLGTIIFVIYLLPQGKDGASVIATLLAGLWTLASVVLLVPRLGINWMAYTVVLAEVLICVTGIVALIYYRQENNVLFI